MEDNKVKTETIYGGQQSEDWNTSSTLKFIENENLLHILKEMWIYKI